MATTYSWIFNTLDCYSSLSGETNVVFNVLWKLVATKTIEEYNNLTGTTYYTYSAKTVGNQPIPLSDSQPFIPYENLTQQIVQGWVEDAMGVDQVNTLKNSLEQNIENQINPPILYLTPPWG